MKKIAWIFIPLFLLACEKSDQENPKFYFGINTLFSHEVTYESQDESFSVTANVVNDSRCPINATCVWQGEAEVAVALEDEGLHIVVLSTFDNLADTINNIRIELVSVEPYPVLGDEVELSSKQVTLRIDKIN